jgi:hypothetical protein
MPPSKIDWQFFPKSIQTPLHLEKIVGHFNRIESKISSSNHTLDSNSVLKIARDGLEKLNFSVEKGKKKKDKIIVPVLFGKNGKLEKSFEADAFNELTKTVVEVEAGRAVINNQFLKDLFQACMMSDVDYLVLAIRKIYIAGSSPVVTYRDFEKVISFFETLYASSRLKLPLKGILVIGY